MEELCQHKESPLEVHKTGFETFHFCVLMILNTSIRSAGSLVVELKRTHVGPVKANSEWLISGCG